MYAPEYTTAILRTIESVHLANNGYIWVDIDCPFTGALVDAGFVVHRSRDQFNRPAFLVATKRANEVLAQSQYGRIPVGVRANPDTDYLDRKVTAQQERLTEGF
jgi:hypothetical protein